MYSIKLRSGGLVTLAALQHALGRVECEVGGEVHRRRMNELGSLERLAARGEKYSNHCFDALFGALNFLDAVAPELADDVRQERVKA